jgi:hypothetical protein
MSLSVICFNDLPHESVSKVRMIHNLQTVFLLDCICTTGNQQSIVLRANTSYHRIQSKDFFDGIHVFERSFPLRRPSENAIYKATTIF